MTKSEKKETTITGKIEQWGVRPYNPYAPPEARLIIVVGKVYGHAGRADGQYIKTSIVTDADGRYITTSSGSVYLLGEPDPHYIEFCKTEGCHMPTEEEPIRMITPSKDGT